MKKATPGLNIAGATFVLWCTMACYCLSPPPPPQEIGRGSSHHQAQGELLFETVTFTVTGATVESYRRFIKDLRNHMTSGRSAHGVAMLRTEEALPMSRRFLIVELIGWNRLSIRLAVDLVNVYVMGYLAGNNRSFFFRDTSEEARQYLFPGATQITLPFGGGYPQLEAAARVSSRGEIGLGVDPLLWAVQNLHSSNHPNTQAHYLIVAIQMISEAARFLPIQNRVVENIRRNTSFRPDAFMLGLENDWSQLSTAVQESNGGTFQRAISIAGESYDSVRWVLPVLMLLLVCREDSVAGLPSTFTKVIKPVVDVGGDIECAIPEPTIRITGRDGKCVDVRYGCHDIGMPIQLRACRSDADSRQFWTLKLDRTIRSNGKCMTASGDSHAVVVGDCDGANTWDLRDDGTIADRRSGLVLSAESGLCGTALKLTGNNCDSSQCWLASNNTKPLVTRIIGYKDLCMQAFGARVWVDKCDGEIGAQKWALYGDGSIRPSQKLDYCLTPVSDQSLGWSIINIRSCDGSSGQRYLFTNKGTIVNVISKNVMDVRGADPSFQQILLYTPNGEPNQEWRLSAF